MTFLQKSYGEYSKVEKPAVLNTSYEGSDDEKELEIVPIDNNDNNINVVSDSDNDSSDENFEINKKNFFEKSPPKTTIDTKVVRAMKKLQAL